MVTYASVARLPDLLLKHTEIPTMVVLDEIHHCGDVTDESGGPAWGRAVRDAFGGATVRVTLSGTPFRSDGTRIPFVSYDPSGTVMPDFAYGYVDALRDGVCRDVIFRPFDGEMTWLSGGEEFRKRFGDELPARERGRRLRTALTAGEWLTDVLRQANHDPMQMRAQGGAHARAGGLVLASDVRHAEHVRDLLHAITGVVPMLAVSDADDARATSRAHDVIRSFRSGDAPWLVAVRMVSEGVDIPRLSVGVYATTAHTDLSFRQAIGRFIRVQEECGEEQHAIVYVPHDPRIDAMRDSIKSEIIHQCLQELIDPHGDLGDGSGDGADDRTLFTPLDAVALDAGAVMGDEVLTPDDIAFGRDIAERTGQPVHYLTFARARRILTDALGAPSPMVTTMLDEPRYVRRKRLRSAIVKLLRQMVRVHSDGGSEVYRSLHLRLNEQTGVEGIAEATVEQLEEQLHILGRWVREGVPRAA